MLPTPSFAKDVDDAGETFAAVGPVGLEALFDAIGVAVCQSANDLVVFGDRELEIADDGAGVETPVALSLRLDGFMPRAEAGARAGDDKPVEVAIDLEDAALFSVVAFDVRKPLVQGFELLHDLHSLCLGQGGGAACGEAFETADDGVELCGVLFC